ncbi:MAG: DUF3244 domain-containing protein [Tannerellaceae bacterium]|nr:DUF3244 domain-containing protein [Tannerellaceae bacterium]
MKRITTITITICCLICLCITNIYASKTIFGHAGEDPRGQRSLPVYPVSAETLNMHYHVTFATACGNVSVTLIGENGNVQTAYFVIDAPQTVSFPLQGFVAGEECQVEVISEAYQLSGTVVIE